MGDVNKIIHRKGPKVFGEKSDVKATKIKEMWEELKDYLKLEHNDDYYSDEYRDGLKHAIDLVKDLEEEYLKSDNGG